MGVSFILLFLLVLRGLSFYCLWSITHPINFCELSTTTSYTTLVFIISMFLFLKECKIFLHWYNRISTVDLVHNILWKKHVGHHTISPSSTTDNWFSYCLAYAWFHTFRLIPCIVIKLVFINTFFKVSQCLAEYWH